MSRLNSRLLTLSLVCLIAVASCAGNDDAAPPSEAGFEVATVAEALVTIAGDESTAITGTLLAVDRGYTLRQVGKAALGASFDAKAGAVISENGYADPEGSAGGFFTDAPTLTSAGALAPSGFARDSSVDDVVNVVGTFLATPPEVLLQDLDSTSAQPATEAKPELLRQATDVDHLHLLITLVMIDAGFSVEQITDAIVFGESLHCASLLLTDCTLGSAAPALSPPNIFGRAAAVDNESATDSEVTDQAGTWAGSVDYTDETVGFEPGTSEVTIVADGDGEYFMTAELTYRTIGGASCTFDWIKTFSGTGETDAAGTSVTFEGTATTKNSSSCPDANLQDLSTDTSVVATLDGSTVSGFVFNSEFTASAN